MNITGIRPYEAIGYYNNRIESKAVETDRTVPAGYLMEEQSAPYLEEPRSNQKETAYDYAQKYDATATYELKGKDSNLSSLDRKTELPKAYRDDALRQYQVFVGGKKNSVAEETSQL